MKKYIMKSEVIFYSIGIIFFCALIFKLGMRITNNLFHVSTIFIITVFVVMSRLITFKKHIIIYGLLFGIVSIIFSISNYLMGFYTKQGITHFFVLLFITVVSIMIGLIAFKKNNNNYISLIEAIKISIGISLLGGLIAILWKILLIHFIDPGIIDQINEKNFKKLAENSIELTKKDIESRTALTKKHISPLILTSMALVEDLGNGLIFGLIGGLIIRKKRDPFN